MPSEHDFPHPPGGPVEAYFLWIRFATTLRAIRELPETPHPGLRHVEGPRLPEYED